jgi:four helix bundle protein
MYKFEKLEIYQLALDYVDLIYQIVEQLPTQEEYNLKSQLRRSATSIALNIAEGSTGQSDAEQSRFLSYAIRSLLETVACQHLIQRRKYLVDNHLLQEADVRGQTLARKIQAMRNTINKKPTLMKEESGAYFLDD